MSNPFDNVRTVPVGTGMAILLPNGELNPAFVHALIRASDLANTLPAEPAESAKAP